METKNIIIIAVLAVIICALVGSIFFMLSSNVTYERIEINPNGTSIEVPNENATYKGEINETGAKLWTFKQGCLMTFNSAEAMDARGIYALGGALGVKEINDMILNHFEEKKTIDGYAVYTIDGNKLDIEGRDTVYCIMLNNDTTHDNIIIATDNLDVTLHMAKSIEYKTTNFTQNNTISNSSTETPNFNDSNSNNPNLQEDLDNSNDDNYFQEYDDYYDDDYDDSDDYYYDSSSSSTGSSGSSGSGSGSSSGSTESGSSSGSGSSSSSDSVVEKTTDE